MNSGVRSPAEAWVVGSLCRDRQRLDAGGPAVVQEVDELAEAKVVEANALQGVCHLVEDEGHGAQTERKYLVVVVAPLPGDA